ncbi:hypothetical protein [Xanthomonas hortorum]|nr:hypothetical protein [Xanthomonas hortorum]MCE4351659.1 hypothetical protein [Xanthomonas hortorum pv. cynarae]MCC8662463.1 hypothetical protein [Xanthomonas hortorum pv. gardneri]MCC8707962.1 hypothetical protein [Xanthomonas hortorum pv. gardneri]MCC8716559.1 hypothetical protein [Xanthomonas hortorum pv. gardneri]MCC8720953.1 hypothetical protein [Xanthomonas hortorum pv. gardneri]
MQLECRPGDIILADSIRALDHRSAGAPAQPVIAPNLAGHQCPTAKTLSASIAESCIARSQRRVPERAVDPA